MLWHTCSHFFLVCLFCFDFFLVCSAFLDVVSVSSGKDAMPAPYMGPSCLAILSSSACFHFSLASLVEDFTACSARPMRFLSVFPDNFLKQLSSGSPSCESPKPRADDPFLKLDTAVATPASTRFLDKNLLYGHSVHIPE